MKKILLTIALLAAASCTHQNQEAKLAFNLNTELSKFGNGKGVEITVFDDRKNIRYVGKKEFSKDKIKITTDQNIAEFLQEKIARNLILKGFVQGRDKVVEIHLKTLEYESEIGFPMGSSEVSGVIKVSVRDVKTGDVFAKNYTLDSERKHFIVSLQSTDEQIINSLLQELTKDIVGDEEFLKSLSK
jgi:uncharacterized lipoprotein YajG